MGNLGKVTFNYAASQPDELDLREGEYVMIVKEEPEDDGWGLARKFAYKGDVVVGYGSEGLIPLNFLEILTQAPANIALFLDGPSQQSTSTNNTRPKAQAPAASSNHNSAPSTKDSALADGMTGQASAVTGLKVAQLKQTLGSDENFLAAVKGTPKQPNSQLPNSHSKEERIIARAEVTFDYAAQQPDELNLTEQQIIQVLSKDADVGWWKGIDPQGKIGVFPHNFVKEIPLSEKKSEPEESREGKPLPTVKGETQDDMAAAASASRLQSDGGSKTKTQTSDVPPNASKAASSPPPTAKGVEHANQQTGRASEALLTEFQTWRLDTHTWLEAELNRIRTGLQERMLQFEKSLTRAN